MNNIIVFSLEIHLQDPFHELFVVSSLFVLTFSLCSFGVIPFIKFFDSVIISENPSVYLRNLITPSGVFE